MAVRPAVPRTGFTRRRGAATDLSFCRGSLQLAPTDGCDADLRGVKPIEEQQWDTDF
jgi:hypothetical protein